MSKKVKKLFKPLKTLAPKKTFNSKWTVWRQAESKANLAFEHKILNRLTIQYLMRDQMSEDSDELYRLQEKVWSYPAHAALSRPKNYCYYVGRARGVHRELFMSRHQLRKFARFGMLPGFIKERE